MTSKRQPPRRTPAELAAARAAYRRKTALLRDLTATLREEAERRKEIERKGGDTSTMHSPEMAVCEVVMKAIDDPHLRGIRLVELLHDAGVSRAVARRRMLRLLHQCGYPTHAPKRVQVDTLTIDWLLDGRARRKRLTAWGDVNSDATPPSPSWPYGPAVLVRPRAQYDAPVVQPVSHPVQLREGTTLTEALAQIRQQPAAPIADLAPSPDPHPVLASTRVDPYFVHLLGGDDGNLKDVETRKQLFEAGFGRDPRVPEDLRPLLGRLASDVDLFTGAIGALHSFGTLTEEQLHLIVGIAISRRRLRAFLNDAHDTGLVQHTDDHRDMPSLPRLYALKSPQTWTRLCNEYLSTGTVLATTGGMPWRGRGPVGRRHDVLAAELLLRWAATGTVRAVLGEAFANRGHLAHEVINHDLRGVTRNWARGRGDGVVVRHDGLNIAIELTANTNAGLTNKVKEWLDYLNSVGHADAGCDVIFILAPDPYQGDLTRQLAKAARAIDSALGFYSRQRVSHRLGLVAWTDWFPSINSVRTEAFATMTVATPSIKRGTWVTRSFLDTTDHPFAPHQPTVATSTIDHALFLGQSPRFLNADRRKILHDQGVIVPRTGPAAWTWGLAPIPAPKVKPDPAPMFAARRKPKQPTTPPTPSPPVTPNLAPKLVARRKPKQPTTPPTPAPPTASRPAPLTQHRIGGRFVRDAAPRLPSDRPESS